MKIIEKLKQDYKESGAVTIAFLGDSVTQGCFESGNGMHGTFDFQAVYHNLLKMKLNKIFKTKPVNIINAGMGGDCAGSAAERIDRDVISHKPDLVVVCFGLNDINDTAEHFQNALARIFGILKENSYETIFMTPNMLNTYVHPKVQPNLKYYAQKTAEYQTGGKMDFFMDCATSMAKTYGVTVCDCYGEWKKMQSAGVDTTELLSNYINHPIRKMHELFADTIIKTIVGGS